MLSVASLVAVTFVQTRVLPGTAEVTIRTYVGVFSLFCVPLFSTLAYREWVKFIRAKLSNWRNGLGLASIVIVWSIWLSAVALQILRSISPQSVGFVNLDWIAMFLYSTLAAALLALALRGTSRIQAVGAAVLMWAWLQTGVYF